MTPKKNVIIGAHTMDRDAKRRGMQFDHTQKIMLDGYFCLIMSPDVSVEDLNRK